MVAPVKLAHIVLRTSKYDEMIAWWRLLLDAEIRHGNDFLSFLSYDDEHHRIAIVSIPMLTSHTSRSTGVEHVAFTFASLDDLILKYEQMKTAGYQPYWTINHGMTMSTYYRDPDGNQVELQVDAMSNAEADAFMKSPTFAANPIGIDVDFDDIVEQRRNGVSVSELLHYPGAS